MGGPMSCPSATDRRGAIPALVDSAKRSGDGLVEKLQQLVCCELDLLVAPFRSPVLTRDQPCAMETPKVPIHEPITGLGFVRGTVRQPEVPFGVLGPGMGLQERVLIVWAR